MASSKLKEAASIQEDAALSLNEQQNKALAALKQGKLDEARRLALAIHQRWPGHVLPAELAALLPAKP